MIELDEGLTLVHLPGISHLLVDASRHPMPMDWRKAAAAWRRKTGLETAPASGVVWYSHKEGRNFLINPAVAVRATRSEHMETACGSASLALALMLHAAAGETSPPEGFSFAPMGESQGQHPPLIVMQPSGESLGVLLDISSDDEDPGQAQPPSHAWVFGSVTLVGEGVAYME